MKLHFHGNTYEDNHTELEVTEGQVGGRYRGTPWRIHRVLKRQQRRSDSSQLKYRGVTYSKY